MTENNVDKRSAFRDRRRSRYVVLFLIDFPLNLFENSIALIISIFFPLRDLCNDHFLAKNSACNFTVKSCDLWKKKDNFFLI